MPETGQILPLLLTPKSSADYLQNIDFFQFILGSDINILSCRVTKFIYIE